MLQSVGSHQRWVVSSLTNFSIFSLVRLPLTSSLRAAAAMSTPAELSTEEDAADTALLPSSRSQVARPAAPLDTLSQFNRRSQLSFVLCLLVISVVAGALLVALVGESTLSHYCNRRASKSECAESIRLDGPPNFVAPPSALPCMPAVTSCPPPASSFFIASVLPFINPSRYWLDWYPLSAASYFPFTASPPSPPPATYSTVLYHEYASDVSHAGHMLSAQLLNVQLIGSTFHLYVPPSSAELHVSDKQWSTVRNIAASGVDMLHSIPVASHLLQSGVMDELYAFTAAPADEVVGQVSRERGAAVNDRQHYEAATHCPLEHDTFGRLLWSDERPAAGRQQCEQQRRQCASVGLPYSDTAPFLLRLLGQSSPSFVESYCTSIEPRVLSLWGLQLHVGELDVTDIDCSAAVWRGGGHYLYHGTCRVLKNVLPPQH